MNSQRCLVTSLSFALLCTTLATPASSQHLSDAWVEKTAAPLVKDGIVDGLSIGYIEGEHFGIVHLGAANDAGEKATYSTLYEIGSITKVFTGILLADAITRGEINLQAAADVPNPAGIRLPSRDGRSIQWLDLSTHRSGLPRLPTNLASTGLTDPYRDYDSKLAAAFVNNYQLPRTPGESQEYSNFGASVLGYLIAAKAGKSYDELLQAKIARPLGMTDTAVSLSTDQTKRLATPHDQVGSPTPPWTFADLPGAGGIRTTMRDMMRFAKAQLNPPAGPLGEAIELAWKQHSDPDDSGPATGLGWMIAGDGQTRWHNGGTGGSSSAIFINRQLKCAVVVLSNTSARNELEPLATKVLLKGAGHDLNAKPAASNDKDTEKLAVDTKLRGRLVGRYQLAPDFIFTVRDRDGHMMVGITNQPTQEVFPDSPTRWSYRGVDATLEFKLPKTGRAKSLVLHQNGLEQPARRID